MLGIFIIGILAVAAGVFLIVKKNEKVKKAKAGALRASTQLPAPGAAFLTEPASSW